VLQPCRRILLSSQTSFLFSFFTSRFRILVPWADYLVAGMARHDDDEHSSRRKRYEEGGNSSGHRPRDSYSSSSRRRSPTRSRSPDLDRHRRRREHTDASKSATGGHRHRGSRGLEDDWRRRDDDVRDRYERRREVDSYRDGERRVSTTGGVDTKIRPEHRRRSRSRSPLPPTTEKGQESNMSEPKAVEKTGPSSPTPADKLKSKKEKLEAWRRERERKAQEEANQKADKVAVPLSNGGEFFVVALAGTDPLINLYSVFAQLMDRLRSKLQD
jgi:hypothetical protein